MKIILAVTGASGSIYAQTLMQQMLESQEVEQIAVVRSDNAKMVWEHELKSPWIEHPIIRYYDKQDFMAPFASGSSAWDAMVILPASMGVIGRVANGISDDLICRASDVMLKEQRKLIVCPRETPFSRIHLKNMLLLQESGATILPTSPSFYSLPNSIHQLVRTLTDRVLDHLGIACESNRWGDRANELFCIT